jgi:Tfp pilus assembly protein PilO
VFEKLAKNIHFIVLFYYAFTTFVEWQETVEMLEQLDQQVESIEGNIRRANREKREITQFEADIEEARSRIELVAQEVERSQQQLPSDVSDTENLSIIRRAAEELNIRDINLSPSGEQNNGFYFTKSYEFSGQGTFLQFLMFFERIGESRRLLNINNVSMQRSRQENRGRFQIIQVQSTIEAYRYNPDHREDRGI